MRALSVECEKNPDKFIRRTYQPLLRSVIKELAEMIGADVEDCVLTGNATTSMNTITWNLDYQPGDVLIACEYIFCFFLRGKNRGIWGNTGVFTGDKALSDLYQDADFNLAGHFTSRLDYVPGS